MMEIELLNNGLLIQKESIIFSCRTEDILFLSASINSVIDLTVRIKDGTEKYFTFDKSELKNITRILTYFCVKLDGEKCEIQ